MFHTRRSFAHYSFMRSLMILFIITISYWIVNKLNLSIDITQSQRYTLTSESIALLQQLEEPLYIYYLESSSMLNRPGIIQVDQLLQQVARTNSAIHYENFAINERPILVSQFTDGEQRIESGSLLIRMGSKQQVIDSYRLLDYYIGNSGAPILMANQTEKLLMETLEQFFHQQTYHLLVVDNHGELTLNNLMSTQHISFMQLLQSRGYQISQGSLLTSNLANVDTLIFLAPTSDLSLEELYLLENWLESGKNIYISLNFLGYTPKNWQIFLEKWGIILHNEGIIEKESSKILAIDPEGFSFMATLANHEITWPLLKQNLKPIFRLPHRLAISPILPPETRQISIAHSSIYTDILTLDESNIFTKSNQLAYEVPLAIALEYLATQDSVGRLYFSSGDTSYINYNYANELLLLQAVDWLHHQVSSIHIPPKNLYQSPMQNIQAQQAILLGLLITVIIPVTLILAGISIYFYRKRR